MAATAAADGLGRRVPIAAAARLRRIRSARRIAVGPDNNLWFTELNGSKIGKITTSGAITEYTIVNTGTPQPWGIASGPDGNLWFTESGGNKIGKITTGGTITEYVLLTTNTHPSGIVTGPDGNLWFTESNLSKIARITP